jgi:SAM-dependent methyltransferase
LDVGAGDGIIGASLQSRGHKVLCLEASQIRVDRIVGLGVPAELRTSLEGIQDGSWDTVLMGEVLEHLDDPGRLLADAFRIARERVVFSVPLLGWCDPTHLWRISLDHLVTANPREDGRPASSEQIVVTWQRGQCWPLGYWAGDEKWQAQFRDGR